MCMFKTMYFVLAYKSSPTVYKPVLQYTNPTMQLQSLKTAKTRQKPALFLTCAVLNIRMGTAGCNLQCINASNTMSCDVLIIKQGHLDMYLFSDSCQLIPMLQRQHTANLHLLHLIIGCLVGLDSCRPVSPELSQGCCLHPTTHSGKEEDKLCHHSWQRRRQAVSS